MIKLNIKDIYFLVLDYYGDYLTSPMLNSQEGELSFVLYDSFVFKFSVVKRNGIFGAGLVLNYNQVLLDVLGEPFAKNNDKVSIIDTLKRIDHYCRLRLPEKFLIAYDEAYKL